MRYERERHEEERLEARGESGLAAVAAVPSRPPAGDGAWGRGARDLSGQIERGRGSCGREAGTNAGALGSLLGRRICDLAVQNEWVVASLVGGVDLKTRNEGDWLGGEHEEETVG